MAVPLALRRAGIRSPPSAGALCLPVTASFAGHCASTQHTGIQSSHRRWFRSDWGKSSGLWTPPHKPLTAFSPNATQKLSDVCKLQLLQRESAVDVREIWLEHYSDKELYLSGVLAKEEYDALIASAGACPMFLLAVPRGDGYLNFIWQFQGNTILISTLEEFKKGAGHNVLVLTLYPELLNSHGLALLHGRINSAGLAKDEAARMIRFIREGYADPTLFAWVKKFNHQAREFDFDEYMTQLRPLERWRAYGE